MIVGAGRASPKSTGQTGSKGRLELWVQAKAAVHRRNVFFIPEKPQFSLEDLPND